MEEEIGRRKQVIQQYYLLYEYKFSVKSSFERNELADPSLPNKLMKKFNILSKKM